MLKYNFRIHTDSRGGQEIYVSVKEPYTFLSQISDGMYPRAIEEFDEIINGLILVQKAEKEEYIFGNQSGFLAIAGLEDEEQEIEEGVYIYDQFGDDSENPLYIIPIEEIIILLKDFKTFIEENS